jgi:arabinofuranosyltransferase
VETGDAPASDVRAGGRQRHRLLNWLLIAVPVAVVAQRGWVWRSVVDDGFIHLRVVHQLVAGHGPVFNIGERVEASTSPLWVYVLAVVDLITPFRLEWIAVVLGLTLTVLALITAAAGARLLLANGGHRGVVVPVGLAVMAALPPTWTYTTSGLEGGLVLAWLGACLLLLARWARHGDGVPAPTAVVIGLGPLIRPELALLTVLFLGVVMIGGASSATVRDRLRILGLALALPVLYQIFRMGYYGSPVPNPAVAKEASRAWWDQGWGYFRDIMDPYWLWVPLGLLAVGGYVPLLRDLGRSGNRRSLLVAGAFGIGGIVHATYIVRVGGDFMPARLLLPSLFAFLAPLAVVPLRRPYALSAAVLPWALVCGLSLRSWADDNTPYRQFVTVEDFAWGEGQGASAFFTGHGFYHSSERFDARPARGRQASVAAFGIGLPAYGLGNDVYIIDLLGLADPFTARLELRRRGFIPGHEKPIPSAWLVARYTEPEPEVTEDRFYRGSFGIIQLDDHGRQGSFRERVALARQVLQCGEVRDLERSYRRNLTPAVFLRNLVEAIPRYRLRIPVEPADARAEFCGRSGGTDTP